MLLQSYVSSYWYSEIKPGFYKAKLVGNKAKAWISKRVLQENKARQVFRKTDISYPLIRSCTCAYQGVRNVRFSENLTCFAFLKQPFWDSLFCLITAKSEDLATTGSIEFSRKAFCRADKTDFKVYTYKFTDFKVYTCKWEAGLSKIW